MKLAFKNKMGWGYSEKDVELIFNIGTLEAVCKAMGIEFYEIGDVVKTKSLEFNSELLYQGYITACKNRYQKPKYTIFHATIWYQYMSKNAQKEFMELMDELFGEIEKMSKKKVEKKAI